LTYRQQNDHSPTCGLDLQLVHTPTKGRELGVTDARRGHPRRGHLAPANAARHQWL